jgi:hypothetical protein
MPTDEPSQKPPWEKKDVGTVPVPKIPPKEEPEPGKLPPAKPTGEREGS